MLEVGSQQNKLRQDGPTELIRVMRDIQKESVHPIEHQSLVRFRRRTPMNHARENREAVSQTFPFFSNLQLH